MVVGMKEDNLQVSRKSLKTKVTQWQAIFPSCLVLGPNLGGSRLYFNLKAVLLYTLYWHNIRGVFFFLIVFNTAVLVSYHNKDWRENWSSSKVFLFLLFKIQVGKCRDLPGLGCWQCTGYPQMPIINPGGNAMCILRGFIRIKIGSCPTLFLAQEGINLRLVQKNVESSKAGGKKVENRKETTAWGKFLIEVCGGALG